MTHRRAALTVILASISVLPAIEANSAQTGSSCFKVLETYHFCPTCPGVATCACLYIGASCPSSESGCYSAPDCESSLDSIVIIWSKPCSWSQPCKAITGSSCDPVLNPCVQHGVSTDSGTMDYCEEVAGACENA